jgi:beta-galactosidase
MWSLGNELQTYSNLPFNDWGVTAYKLQKVLLGRYDTTRPVTVAMHPRGRSLRTDSIPAPLALETDIASYNYRYMYFPGDGRRYPGMVFYQSEANLSGMGPNFFEPDNDKVVGLAYWGMIDYLGESFGWPAKGWVNGVFDISLQPKPRAYLLKSMFSDEPTVHVCVAGTSNNAKSWNGVKMDAKQLSDHWNYSNGDTLSVTVFTNAQEVDLRINGRSAGRRSNPTGDPKHRDQLTWDGIIYAEGNIEAVAYNDGKPVARHRIETAGKPVRLTATPDNAEWQADGTDLQYVRINAVDSKGRLVPYAQGELKFEVTGDATIIATDNGDITSDELHTSPVRSLYGGSALVILRAGRTASGVTLKVTSADYKPLTLKLATL